MTDLGAVLAIGLTFVATAGAADQPRWGQEFSRNMVSQERGLADHFDPGTRDHVKWVAKLGSQSYSTPIVTQGKVLIGTNNNSRAIQSTKAIAAC